MPRSRCSRANRPTPLHRLPGLARALGLDGLWLKDESGRFGLDSFKALGGAYAVILALREGARGLRLESAISSPAAPRRA